MRSLIFGHLPDGTVPQALAQVRDLFGDSSGAIIKSIDSAHSERDLSRALALHGIAYEVSSGNICVSISCLWRAMDTEVFTGFDEVWIYRDELPNFNLEAVPSATSDGIDFSAGTPLRMAEAMEQTRCVLVVADGCGLNYATYDGEVGARLTRNFE